MHVVVKEYAAGGRGAYETSNDGGTYLGEWTGPRAFNERECGYLEVACDDTEEGYRRLLESMTWLAEEIKKRREVGRAQPTEVG